MGLIRSIIDMVMSLIMQILSALGLGDILNPSTTY
jgi:hypothetical protein